MGNLLTSYSGFHVFPRLTRIDLRGNPVTFSPILTIAAIGSLRITEIDGQRITREQFQTAFQLSPIVGHALRFGRDPARQPDETAAAIAHLTPEPPLQIGMAAGCAVLTCPRDGPDNATWFMSANTESEWETLCCRVRVLSVTESMNNHLIRCDCDSKFSYYTADVVNRQPAEAVAPFPSALVIEGSPTVGSMLVVDSADDFPVELQWKVEDTVFATDRFAVVVPLEFELKTITVEVRPVSHGFPSVVFSKATTNVSIAKLVEPEVLAIEFVGDPVEDVAVGIEYRVFPDGFSVPLVVESSAAIEGPYSDARKVADRLFMPVAADAGKFLRVTATVGGRDFRAYTVKPVVPCGPKIRKAIIAGSFQVCRPHVLLVEFSDGVARDLRITWVIHNSGRAMRLSHNSPIFIPMTEMQSLSLAAEVTCVFDDGPRTLTVTSPPLKPGAPLLDTAAEQPVEDVTLAMNHAGEWLISDINAPSGFRLLCENEYYSPTHSDIGHYLRFRSDNIDKIFGIVEPARTPIRSVVLQRTADIVGVVITANIEFYPGRECDYKIRWVRCCRTKGDTIIQEGGQSYVTSFADCDTKIRARALVGAAARDSESTAILKRGLFALQVLRGELRVGATLSIATDLPAVWFHDCSAASIAAGPTLRLAHVDLGHRIRVSLFRKAQTYDELSEATVTAEPVFEDQVITLADVFHGDRETGFRNLWFRYDFSRRAYDQVGEGPSYRLAHADVGATIRVVSVDVTGDELCADITSISPAPFRMPSIVFDARGHIVIDAPQRTLECAKISWRKWRNGRSEVLKKCTEPRLVPHPALVGCSIDAGLQLPDEDVFWTNQLSVDYAVPLPDAKLPPVRPLVPGVTLTVELAAAPGLRPHFHWRRWNGQAFLPAPHPTPPFVYPLTDADVSCYLCCDICMIDGDGRRSAPVVVETADPIDPIGISGRPICGGLLDVVGSPAVLTRARAFAWQRCDANDRWIELARRRGYRCSANDVGCVLRVVAVIDGAEPCVAESDAVEADPDTRAKAAELVRAGPFKIKGTDHDGDQWLIEVAPTLVTVKSSRRTSKTVPIRDFEVRAAPSERKLLVAAGGNLKITVKHPSIQGKAWEPYVVRDVCIVAVGLQKQKTPPPAPSRHRR
jgi:hypothetical protein